MLYFVKVMAKTILKKNGCLVTYSPDSIIWYLQRTILLNITNGRQITAGAEKTHGLRYGNIKIIFF